MESLLFWLTQHSDIAPLLIFGLLVIAGFSLPISEDLLLIAGGVLASTVMPEKTIELFLAVFLGSYASDIIAYVLGRHFGEKIYSMKRLSASGQKKLDALRAFYVKHGIWALMIGRCIPFGLRNGIFMTAGAGKMHLGKFLLSDAIACALFSSTLFYLAYSFGSNFDELSSYVHHGGIIALCIALIAGLIFFIMARRKKTEKTATIQD
jgi:membrane protein DedA with SNARE-associated domain